MLLPKTQYHIMEVCVIENTSFQTLTQILDHQNLISLLELSLLMGMMVHPHSSFTMEPLTFSVRMEWLQEYMI